ncbi:hypothetical protein FRACA_1430015 [Frankia canadensis]|uniref:Uncharacterized protein n=1 Tax=Frankia canadensis TaxID=1836972 RepID=A0A2I2KLJ9_9ACTN|nr:hypothetical protein FRACA_1430015 [Frankia canadensis]SOU53824.1 hypothetical protein FRACA_1430015 [Frankia canadensis]
MVTGRDDDPGPLLAGDEATRTPRATGPERHRGASRTQMHERHGRPLASRCPAGRAAELVGQTAPSELATGRDVGAHPRPGNLCDLTFSISP